MEPLATSSVASSPAALTLPAAEERAMLNTIAEELSSKRDILTRHFELLERANAVVTELIADPAVPPAELARSFNQSLGVEVFQRIDLLLAQTPTSEEAKALRELSIGLLAAIEEHEPERAAALRRDVFVWEGNPMIGPLPERPPAATPIADEGPGVEGPILVGDGKLSEDEFMQALNATESFMRGDIPMDDLVDFYSKAGASSDQIDSLTRIVDKLAVTPPPGWLPAAMKNWVVDEDIAPIPESILADLKSKIFTKDLFKFSSTSTYGTAVLFRGISRDPENPAEMTKVLQAKLLANPAIDEAVHILYRQSFSEDAEDGELLMDGMDNMQLSDSYLVVPKAVQPPSPGATQYLFTFGCSLLTALSLIWISVTAFNSNPAVIAQVEAGDTSFVENALPIAVALAGVQAVHELAHIAVGLFYDTRLSLPLFLPSFSLGTFGGLTKFLTYPKNRNAGFDVALAGPVAGMLTAFGLLVYGVAATASASPEASAGFPVVPSSALGSSVIAGATMYLGLPGVFDFPGSIPVSVHPMIIAGMTGMLVNAINLMPVGRLDGGRALLYALGSVPAGLISGLASIFLVVTGLFGDDPAFQPLWILFVFTFQGSQDLPPLDDITDIGVRRKLILFGVTVLAVACLVPLDAFTAGGSDLGF